MRTFRQVSVLFAIVVAACGDDGIVPEAPATLTISVHETGMDMDSTAYAITVDGVERGTVRSGAPLPVTGLQSGSHSVVIVGGPANCSVTDAAREVTLAPGTTVPVIFEAACTAVTGDLSIEIETEGLDFDPNGLVAFTIDDVLSATPLPANDTTLQQGLADGPHEIVVSGWPSNCTPDGADRITFDTETGGLTRHVARVSFAFVCTAVRGVIEVSVSGNGFDVDSLYTVAVDTSTLALRLGEKARLASTGGDHAVTLGEIAPNCLLGGPNPRTVTVNVGTLVRDTARTAFDVACTRPIARIITTTTGTGVDNDGYLISAGCGPSCSLSWSVAINDTILTNRIPSGQQTVELRGVNRGCTVDGANPLTAMFAGDTVEVVFAVECAEPGTVRVTTRTTGVDLDANGFEVAASDPAGAPSVRLTAVPVNGVVETPLLAAGTSDVFLGGVSANCTVTGSNSVEALVPSGGSVDVAFDITCEPAGELAVAKLANGNWEIFRQRLNDAPPTRLTYNAGSDTEPAWSFDASRIAFISDRDGRGQVYVMNADGTGTARLTDLGTSQSAAEVAWSPDGSKLAFSVNEGGSSSLYLMDATGANVSRLRTQAESPDWAPDGTKIAFASAGHIYLIAPDGSGLTDLGGTEAKQPAWSPDSQRIAFATRVWGYYCPDYYGYGYYGCWIGAMGIVNADGTNGVTIASLSPDEISWSPDGQWLAVESGGSTSIVSPDGSGGRWVGSLVQPDWRP